MAEISEYGLYDIDDLVATWKKGAKQKKQVSKKNKCFQNKNV